ncbi:MAG: metalloregulator ArsR/SmtB family transcription factor [Fimbriimonadales bacterium]
MNRTVELEQTIVRKARALSDPTRLTILHTLLLEGELSCGQVAERFPLAQPTISHHLNTLVQAGFVAMRKQGQHHYFKASPEMLRAFAQSLLQLTGEPKTEHTPYKEG